MKLPLYLSLNYDRHLVLTGKKTYHMDPVIPVYNRFNDIITPIVPDSRRFRFYIKELFDKYVDEERKKEANQAQ